MSCIARELCGGVQEDKARAFTVMSSSSSGFGYSDHFSLTPGSPIQPSHLVAASAAMGSSYESGSEIFNLASSVNLIGFPKNIPHHLSGLSHQDSDAAAVAWTLQHHHHQKNDIMVPPSLIVDGDGAGARDDWEDSALRRSVFPCERNERPSQGLSLSLSSTNPSGIGLQSFELRHAVGTHFNDHQGSSVLGKSIQLQQMAIEQFNLRNSKHLIPAQELLNEFCSLGSNDDSNSTRPQSDVVSKHNDQKGNKTSEEDENRNGSSSSSSSKQQLSLQPLELMELQKRETKLLAMLNEVDRRYRHYCNHMKAVVSSFEAVAGDGTATVYSSLASNAMSRHFRCLRDGIMGQIQVTKKAMGEKDTVAPGMTKGETPRLRIIDQAIRQQRALQQMSMIENHPWRPQRGLPERSVSVLRAWLFEHFLHPYPSDVDKHILSRQTGLSRSQVSNWFINARVRLWKPMVEEMYLEETKEHDNLLLDGVLSPTDIDEKGRPDTRDHLLLLQHTEDQKPSSDQLIMRMDSEFLSSIISGPDPKTDIHHHNHLLAKIGSRNPNPIHHDAHLMQNHNNQWTELDFTSYNQNAAIPYHGVGTNFGGVSLTLGLQQHGGSHQQGVSLAFSSAAPGSLFFPREQIEDCHPGVQYSSILDGEGQNLPYRDLMGAQLLQDLAG